MAHGGKRPGAGRKKGRQTLDKEAARAFVRQKVYAELASLLQAQIDNANGVKYLVTRDKKTGKFIRVTEAMARAKQDDSEEIIEVWEKEPSVQAFTDLMNRALDKPKEQEQEIRVSGDDALIQALQAGRLRAAQARQLTAPVIEAQAVPVTEPRKVQ